MLRRLSDRQMWGLCGAVFAVYLLQAFGPLRLHTDAISYLQLAASAADGAGYLIGGEPTRYPDGYPFVVSILDRLGWGNPASLVLLNLLYLGSALVLFRAACGIGARVVLVTLLSFAVIQNTLSPASDLLFLVFVSVTLLISERAAASSGREKAWRVLAALVGAYLAIRVRTVGITLIPAVVIAALPAEKAGAVWRRNRFVVIASIAGTLVLLAAGLFLGSAWRGTVYLEVIRDLYQEAPSVPGIVLQVVGYRLIEVCEIFLNVPYVKTPASLGRFFPLLGSALLVEYLLHLRRKGPSFGPTAVFLLFYAAVILPWPYHGTRFWLPLLPLLYAWRLRDFPTSRMAKGVVIWFLAAGLAGLAYSTRLTFSGDRFPERYGDGSLGNTYRAAMGMPADPASPPVREDALEVLNRFGWRRDGK